MNPEKYKFKFGFEPLDLEDITKYSNAIDIQKLQALIKDYDDGYFNKNFNASTAVRSTMLDMDVIIGMRHDGEMEIIKNERGEEGLKYVSINIIMRMFIKALRAGIMKFNTNRFQLFSAAVEKDLEDAIMEVVRKYSLEEAYSRRDIPRWEKK